MGTQTDIDTSCAHTHTHAHAHAHTHTHASSHTHLAGLLARECVLPDFGVGRARPAHKARNVAPFPRVHAQPQHGPHEDIGRLPVQCPVRRRLPPLLNELVLGPVWLLRVSVWVMGLCLLPGGRKAENEHGSEPRQSHIRLSADEGMCRHGKSGMHHNQEQSLVSTDQTSSPPPGGPLPFPNHVQPQTKTRHDKDKDTHTQTHT